MPSRSGDIIRKHIFSLFFKMALMALMALLPQHPSQWRGCQHRRALSCLVSMRSRLYPTRVLMQDLHHTCVFACDRVVFQDGVSRLCANPIN